MTEETEHLRSIPIFAGLGDGDLARVAEVVQPFEVEAGHVLAEPNQPGTGFFVISEGTVEVELPGGAKVPLGPGEFVGELAILADVDRIARVRSTSPVRGYAISRVAFASLLEQEPAIGVAMLPVVARRLANLERELGR
jgi:CRP-like cAMP-binding protein